MTISYNIRSFFVLLLFYFAYGIILFNLYIIQIKQRDFFIHLGSKQYNITTTSPPPRASILDRNGQPLAVNKDCVSAFIMPAQLADKEQLEAFLAQHFPAAHKRLATHPNSRFLYVQRKLDKEQLMLIENEDIADIHLLKEPGRFYPVPSTGIITGITNIENKGLLGLEYQLDKLLAGSPTTFSLEKDARSGLFYFKKETKVQGHEGTPVTLTIDNTLQFLVHEELKETIEQFKAKEGAALVLDPISGDILAMTTFPDFDPNNTKQLDIEHTKNRVLGDAYELGSVIKTFAALAALEEGVVTPDELIDCENKKTTTVNGTIVNTILVRGLIPFSEVIESSNNIGISKVTQRLDYKLYDHYTKIGFGSKTGINFPGEHQGFVNHPANWSRPSIISLSFGYEITATIMQLAKAFGIIANNGYDVQPRLFLEPAATPLEKKRLYNQQTIDEMRDILRRTITRGTARRAQVKGYTVMGKTGTANLIVDGKYRPDKNIYSFGGIIEKGDYKRVVATFVKDSAHKNIYASTVTAPLFERIAEKVLIHDKIL